MQHHNGSCSWNVFVFSQSLYCFEPAPLCFDSLALLNAQSNNSSCGEERADTVGKKIWELTTGQIDKQSRSCDLFTVVCYVEARAGRRKAF